MVCRTAPATLTARQEQILNCIGQGMTNREIGHHLGVTEKTVKNTITAIFAALHLQRRSQAAVYVALREHATAAAR